MPAIEQNKIFVQLSGGQYRISGLLSQIQRFRHSSDVTPDSEAIAAINDYD